MIDIVKFTNKVGAKSLSFMLGENDLHTSYCTIVQSIDGKKMTIKDENSPNGLMCGETRAEAIKKGRLFLKSID